MNRSSDNFSLELYVHVCRITFQYLLARNGSKHADAAKRENQCFKTTLQSALPHRVHISFNKSFVPGQ